MISVPFQFSAHLGLAWSNLWILFFGLTISWSCLTLLVQPLLFHYKLCLDTQTTWAFRWFVRCLRCHHKCLSWLDAEESIARRKVRGLSHLSTLGHNPSAIPSSWLWTETEADHRQRSKPGIVRFCLAKLSFISSFSSIIHQFDRYLSELGFKAEFLCRDLQ